MLVDFSEVLTKMGLASSAENWQLGLLNQIHPEVEQTIKNICGCGLEQNTYTHILPAKQGILPRDQLMDQFDTVGSMAINTFGELTTGNILQLPEVPVRSITSVYEDRNAYGGQFPGAWPAGTLLTQGTHFWLDVESDGFSRTGQLRRIASCWSTLPRTIKVTYVAGYTADEINGAAGVLPEKSALPVKEAVLMGIAASYNVTLGIQDGADGPIVKDRIGDREQQFDRWSTQSGYKVIIPKSARQRLRPYINLARFYGA